MGRTEKLLSELGVPVGTIQEDAGSRAQEIGGLDVQTWAVTARVSPSASLDLDFHVL